MPPTSNIPDIEKTYNLFNNITLGLLIFAGVIALLIAVFSVLSNRKGGDLIRAKDGQLKHDLKDKDVQIELVIKQAEKDKQESDEKIASLKTQAESLKVEAEKAKEGIAKAQSQAAQANEKAESERLARVKLEISLMPRHLTNIQRAQLGSLLAKEPKGEIAIGCIEITQEALDFGQEIYNTLKTAGWKVQGVNTLLASGLSFSGLLITVKTQNSPSSHLAGVLQRALKEVGIEAPAKLDNNLSESQIVLLIGAKS